jgi:uracil-DNA glycosylase
MTCYSRGNILADVLILGECPGYDEVNNHPLIHAQDVVKLSPEQLADAKKDAMPIPFCGPSGRILHRLLFASHGGAGLIEGEFVLDNAVNIALYDSEGKSRTPDVSELTQHRPALILKIVKMQPNLIITLGRGPIWALYYHEKKDLDQLRMSNINGTVHQFSYDRFTSQAKMYLQMAGVKDDVVNAQRTIPILPLYHPSAILRKDDTSIQEAVMKAVLQNREIISDAVGRVLL